MTRFVWDGSELLAEMDASGNVLTSYVHGIEPDEVLYQENYGFNETLYFHQDTLMSTLALTTSTGTVKESYTYDPYGNLLTQPTVSSTRLLYTGRELDREINLYYNRARYYDPQLGRFINTDPKGYAAGLNLYTYTRNNPISYRDPEGLDVYWGGGAQSGPGGPGPGPQGPLTTGPQGVQPPPTPKNNDDDDDDAEDDEVFPKQIEIKGPLDQISETFGSFINNPPDSTFASGILGGLEKAGGITFLKQSVNPATQLPIPGHHFIEPLTGLGRLAAKTATGLDIALSSLEIAKVLRSEGSGLNKALKVDAVISANILVFIGAALLVASLASTLAGAIAAGSLIVILSLAGEYVKKGVFQMIEKGTQS